jgi:SAM-dependent methyltransferase
VTDPWAGPVLSAYEQALWQSLSGRPAPVRLHAESGEDLVLDVARYSAAADGVDTRLLGRCTGPTLDIGCGPGRLAAELAHRGVPALGVDAAPIAVLLARAAGATALRRSVFDRLPGEGRWQHALLIDGNIGIGGDPAALLIRIRTLLAAGGELVVETAAGAVDDRSRLRVGDDGATMAWARLGTEAVRELAASVGYTAGDGWKMNGRHFLALST